MSIFVLKIVIFLSNNISEVPVASESDLELHYRGPAMTLSRGEEMSVVNPDDNNPANFISEKDFIVSGRGSLKLKSDTDIKHVSV